MFEPVVQVQLQVKVTGVPAGRTATQVESVELNSAQAYFFSVLQREQWQVVGGELAVLRLALQEALVPPLLPLQVQVQGPEPETALAVPALHKFVVGAEEKEEPLAESQAPLIGGQGPVLKGPRMALPITAP